MKKKEHGTFQSFDGTYRLHWQSSHAQKRVTSRHLKKMSNLPRGPVSLLPPGGGGENTKFLHGWFVAGGDIIAAVAPES